MYIKYIEKEVNRISNIPQDFTYPSINLCETVLTQ